MAKTPRDAAQSNFSDSGIQFQKRLPASGDVIRCLGKEFKSEDERRAYYLELLSTELKNPAFRQKPGFPQATDAAILHLSDPPYFTACPNPFFRDFVDEASKLPKVRQVDLVPFVADISEGKGEHYYNVHTYHTKVPYRAIAKFILHYTTPGDIVLDAFCGTGMTGLASQACASAEFVREIEPSTPDTNIGERVALLVDLSPAATSIAQNYNNHADGAAFEKECGAILREFDNALGWMFSTTDPVTGKVVPVSYYVWSDVFACPECAHEILFWDEGVDDETGYKKTDADMTCPSCQAKTHRDNFVRVEETFFDDFFGEPAKRQKERLVLVFYKSDAGVVSKAPDEYDETILERIKGEPFDTPVPVVPMNHRTGAWGDMYRAGYHIGITHFHHFYQRRSLRAVSWLWSRVRRAPPVLQGRLRWWLQSVGIGHTKMNRYFSSSYSQVNRYLKGFLYIAQVRSEVSPRYALNGKIKKMSQNPPGNAPVAISTSSATALDIPSSSIDYIFTDPPFGGNIIYSELNFMWEAWFGVFTNQAPEAIISKTQSKSLVEYQRLMEGAFAEYYRVLKPGRWMTVLFHNSHNAVWNSIQSSLERAGFVVADVRVFDKKQQTMKQQTTTGAVQKDLVITAYRPSAELETIFLGSAGSETGAWEFVRNHLRQLPTYLGSADQAEVILERQAFMLFNRMVAYHLRRGLSVPMSAPTFYDGLRQRFSERDEMYFLSEQVSAYDRRKVTTKQLLQMQFAVIDEASAIKWLRQELERKPQRFQELQPKYMREAQSWAKHERPLELGQILQENFLLFDGSGPVPQQIMSWAKKSSTIRAETSAISDGSAPVEPIAEARNRWYVPDVNKALDLEKLRERALLREFDEIVAAPKRVKELRTEACRAGFKKLWEDGEYKSIMDVAKKLPPELVEEDSWLLMYTDLAKSRLDG